MPSSVTRERLHELLARVTTVVAMSDDEDAQDLLLELEAVLTQLADERDELRAELRRTQEAARWD